MHPDGRTALVTGGAHRVGRALSLALAREGADVVVHFHSSAAAAAATVDEIAAMGRRATAVQADLSRPDAADALIGAAEREMGRLDILVNSASLFESSPFEEIDADDWDRVMAVNLRAPFLLTRAAAPLLRRDGGVVVNIADLSGLRPWPSYAHHGVSKAGLIHLTKAAARSLATEVRVNCIVPGTVLPPGDYTEAEVDRSVERTVLKRIGSPEDVAHALLFLVRSDFATGSVVVVDGGRMLR